MKKYKNDLFPELTTRRLILRKINLDDAKSLFKYWSDNEVTKYLNMEPFVTMQQTFRMIKTLNGLFNRNEGIRWAIVRKEDNAIIGTCGFNNWIMKSSRGEVGYELGRIYWGNGYATESLKEMLRYGFEEIKLNRIEAFTVPEAHKSINLLKKLGFKKEGTLREYGYWNDKYHDENIYSLLKRDWILENKL